MRSTSAKTWVPFPGWEPNSLFKCFFYDSFLADLQPVLILLGNQENCLAAFHHTFPLSETDTLTLVTFLLFVVVVWGFFGFVCLFGGVLLLLGFGGGRGGFVRLFFKIKLFHFLKLVVSLSLEPTAILPVSSEEESLRLAHVFGFRKPRAKTSSIVTSWLFGNYFLK